MDPTITAAIISAAVGVATTVATEAGRQEGSPVSGIIMNNSQYDFAVTARQCIHGHSFEVPSTILKGAKYLDDRLLSAVRSRFGDEYSERDKGKEEAVWIRENKFEPYAKECTVEFGGTGDGIGYEQVICLQAEEDTNNTIINILVRKLPGGDYGAGFSISNNGWYKFNNDSDGSEIADYIKSVATEVCQYSDGSGSISGTLGDIRVVIQAPGEQMKVFIDTP
jgi:hypothetical protein